MITLESACSLPHQPIARVSPARTLPLGVPEDSKRWNPDECRPNRPLEVVLKLRNGLGQSSFSRERPEKGI